MKLNPLFEVMDRLIYSGLTLEEAKELLCQLIAEYNTIKLQSIKNKH